MMARSGQRGAMLVESLVAVTLLSAALSGSALLLVQALRHERSAAERTVALRQAATLADDLRALRRRDGRPLQSISEPQVAIDCPVEASDCLLEEMARERLHAWRLATISALPEGATAVVEWLAAPAPAYVVAITWPSFGVASGSTVQLPVEP